MKKAYKGFNRKDMSCNKRKYKEGGTYKAGGHPVPLVSPNMLYAYEYPPACFYTAAPAESVYHTVEQRGEISYANETTMTASTKITVREKVSGIDMARGAIQYLLAKTLKNKIIVAAKEMFSTNSEDTPERLLEVSGTKSTAIVNGNESIAEVKEIGSVAVATGVRSAAMADSYGSAAFTVGPSGTALAKEKYSAAIAANVASISASVGENNIAGVTDTQSMACTEKDCCAASATNIFSAAIVNGKYSAASVTARNSRSEANGNRSMAFASGANSSASASAASVACVTDADSIAEANSPDAVAIAWGRNCCAQGVKGSTLVLSEWIMNKSRNGEVEERLKNIKTVRVDGAEILENTPYMLYADNVIAVKMTDTGWRDITEN